MVAPRKPRVRVDPRRRLSGPQHPLQPEQMPVHPEALPRPRRVLQVSGHRRPEQPPPLPVPHVRVQHRLRPRLALAARTPDHLRPPLLVFPRLAALVRHPGPAHHHLERQLLDQLHPRVRRHLEFLHHLLAVPLVVQHLHLMLAHQRVKVLTCGVNIPVAPRVQLKRELDWRPESRPRRRRPRRPEIHLARRKRRQHELVHPQRRRPVHARVLSEKPGPPIVKHEHW